MPGKIFTITPEGTLQSLEETPYASEDEFQDLIAQYPDLLAGDQIDPADIQNGSAKTSLESQYDQSNTLMVSQCSNVEFILDAQPLQTRYVTIAFDMVENEVTHHYQIESALRSWAGHLLDASGNIVSDDD